MRRHRWLPLALAAGALAACSYGEPGTPGSITTHAGGQAGVYGAVSSGR